MTTTHDRFFASATTRNVLHAHGMTCIPVEEAVSFAEEEAKRAVAEALQPREPSPELAEAEKWLRTQDGTDGFCNYTDTIAAELDRLRALIASAAYDEQGESAGVIAELRARCERAEAEVERLQAAPSRVVYTPAFSEEGACAAVAGHGYFVDVDPRTANRHPAELAQGQAWYPVTLSARKVET